MILYLLKNLTKNKQYFEVDFRKYYYYILIL